jgi:hypothetical protein
MDLKDYPRPQFDTGYGFHWNAGAYPDANTVQNTIPLLKELGATWLKLVCAGDAGVAAAQVAAQAGIEPIIRLYRERPHPGYVVDGAVVAKYLAAGAHYFEWGNEPNLVGEWQGPYSNVVGQTMEQFLRNANVINQAGGIALFPALTPGGDYSHDRFYADAFAWLQQHNALGVFDRNAIAIHNRPLNHPLDYPYDPINQHEHPGSTVANDSVCFLMYQLVDDLCQQYLGRSVPILGTEAGTEPGQEDDRRYPKITYELHGQVNAAIADGMMSGRWRQSLFTQCFWLLGIFGHYAFEAAAWLQNPLYNGQNLPAIGLVKALPKRPRPFAAPVPQPDPSGFHCLLLGQTVQSIVPWSWIEALQLYLQTYRSTLTFSHDDAQRYPNVSIVGAVDAPVPVSAEAEAIIRQNANVKWVERIGVKDAAALQTTMDTRVQTNNKYGLAITKALAAPPRPAAPRPVPGEKKPLLSRLGWSLIAVAIVWAAVILAAAALLKNTPYWAQMLLILGGGAAATIILLGSIQRGGEQ